MVLGFRAGAYQSNPWWAVLVGEEGKGTQNYAGHFALEVEAGDVC